MKASITIDQQHKLDALGSRVRFYTMGGAIPSEQWRAQLIDIQTDRHWGEEGVGHDRQSALDDLMSRHSGTPARRTVGELATENLALQKRVAELEGKAAPDEAASTPKTKPEPAAKDPARFNDLTPADLAKLASDHDIAPPSGKRSDPAWKREVIELLVAANV